MPSSDSSREALLERLAEEFVERHRRGEHPALSEYADRHPDLATEIRDLFPALVKIEHLKPAAGDLTGDFIPENSPRDRPTPEHLGDYRILREIGHGGMGVVYEAEQVSLGRHVALKVLPVAGLMNPTYLERFCREAKAAARLHHTNIVPVFGVGEADGVHFYAMQFIKGQSLDQVLSDVRRLRKHAGTAAGMDDQPRTTSEGSVAQGLLTGQFEKPPAGGPDKSEQRTATAQPTPAAEPWSGTGLSAGGSETQYFRSVARVGLQAADALAYAHRQGIVHRDIKPSNLLLDQQGTVWITDFGLAKAEGTDELTHTGDIVGTIRFMAPERFDGRSQPQSDVYSLGLTLYEMLTLRPAFHHASRARLIEKVLHEPPVPPRKLDPHIPRDLETIVLKCLAKDAAGRYATAEELAEDLRRFLADRTIRARRASRWERTWRWCRRNPVVASLLAAVVLLLATVAVVSAFYAAHQKTAATDLAGALRDSEAKRWESLRDQARAMRMSRHPGQRVKSLQAIQEAMQLPLPQGHSLDELRTEAIAALALLDVEVLQEWEGWPAGTGYVNFDGNLERYARLATDGTVSVRRVSDDAEIARWQERTEGAWPHSESNLHFSPDGRFLCVRHSASGRLTVRRLDGPEPIVCHQGIKVRDAWAMDFSPDGKRLAYLQMDTRIVVVDLTSGKVRHLPPTGADDQEHIRFAPDGRRFALKVRRADKEAIEVRDVDTGEVQRSLPHPNGVNVSAWHPDGRALATVCEGRLIRLWDLASGRLLRVLEGHKNEGMRCAFTHTGNRLVSNDWDNVLRIWEPSSGRQLLHFSAAGYDILRVSLADRASALHFSDKTRLQLLRLHAGLEYRTIAPGCSRGRNIAYDFPNVHPGGQLLAATGTDGSLVLIDLASGREVATLLAPGPGERPLLWGPAGDLLTCGTSGLLRWPVLADPMKSSRYRLGPPEQLLSVKGGAVASSTDGQTIAFPDYSRGAIVVHRGRPLRTVHLQPQQDVRNCAVSPDGHWVATGSHGNTDGLGAKVWDAVTGELAKAFRVPWFCEVTFSPDGRWLMTTSGGCRLWEVGSWEEGPKVGGASGCFAPDGQLLAVEDSPGSIRLVRPESGRELARLEAPEQTRLIPRCFTPDGSRLIALGAETRALHVWDLRLIRKELV